MVNANDQYQGEVTGEGHELLKSLLIVRLQAKPAATSSLLSVGPFMCVGPRESTATDWGG